MNDTERKAAIDAFLSRVSQAKRPIVTSHVSPDGDAVGSILGLASFLEQAYGARPHCALHDPVPKLYEWLSGVERITGPEEVPQDGDLFIVADTHQLARTGRVAECVPSGIPAIVIDHHIVRGEVPEHSYLDSTAAAVGEMVGELFVHTNTPYTPEAATACYVALSTDTGCFRYPSTTSRTHLIASTFIDGGVDVGDVTERVFDRMSPSKFALLGRVLDRVEMAAGGRVAVSSVTLADLAECDASHEDTEGLINFLRNVDGVDFAIVARETAPDVTKVSFRARPGFNASELARRFDGGGHAAAAGATIEQPLAEACAEVVAHASETLLEPGNRERNLTG